MAPSPLLVHHSATWENLGHPNGWGEPKSLTIRPLGLALIGAEKKQGRRLL